MFKISLGLAHKISIFLYFFTLLTDFIIIFSGSMPVSAILPANIDIIVGQLLLTFLII